MISPVQEEINPGLALAAERMKEMNYKHTES